MHGKETVRNSKSNPSIIAHYDINIIMTEITYDDASGELVSVSCHNARHQMVIKVNKSWNLFFMDFHWDRMRGCVLKENFVDINVHIFIYTHELVKQHVRFVTAADGESTTSTISLSNLHKLMSSFMLWRAIIINTKRPFFSRSHIFVNSFPRALKLKHPFSYVTSLEYFTSSCV